MTVYTVSFFSNGERPNATDGVYTVCASLTQALKYVTELCENENDDMIDIDSDRVSRRIYTNNGTYLIEMFEVEDDNYEDEDEYEDEDDVGIEIGFNPYMGTYDWDC